MTHWCTPSHANRAVCCAAFFGSGQQDTLHHPHPTLHHLTSCNTHQQSNTDTTHGASNNEMTIVNEKGIGQRAKVGQHSSTNTLIEVATNTMALKQTGLWLTIEGWVGVGGIDNDKVFDTKPSHSSTPSNHQTTLSSLFTLKLKPLAFCPFHNTPHPSPFPLCASHTATTTHHLIVE